MNWNKSPTPTPSQTDQQRLFQCQKGIPTAGGIYLNGNIYIYIYIDEQFCYLQDKAEAAKYFEERAHVERIKRGAIAAVLRILFKREDLCVVILDIDD
jgi:hypothetical protein